MHRGLISSVLILATGLLWRGGQSAPAVSTTNNPPPHVGGYASNAAGTNAVAISLAEIAPQAESATATLQTIAADVSNDKVIQAVQQDLPVITREISARLEENSKILARDPSLDLLRRLNSEWQDIREELSNWKRDLTKRATQLEADIGRLAQLEKTWELTGSQSGASNMPPELAKTVDSEIAQISDTLKTTRVQQNLVLTLQTRVAEQDARVSQAIAAIEHAREQTVGHLLARDTPPLWNLAFRSNTAQDIARQSHRSLGRQLTALGTYTKRKAGRFLLHGTILSALVAIMSLARRRLRGQGEDDARLKHAKLVFEAPIATALVLSLVASSWIYSQAPRLLWAILGAAALIPAAIVLRRLISRPLFPVLNGLIVFYLFDQLRSVAAAPELLSRVLFLVEMLAGIIFVLWLLKSRRLMQGESNRWRKILRCGVWTCLTFLALAFAANICGYGGLSKLIGNATLTSAYLAMILYALIQIADGLILTALSVPPLGRLDMARRHRSYLQDRTRQVFEWAAICIWGVYTLEAFSLRAPVFQDLKEILTARLAAGSVNISLGDVLLFGVTIWAAFMASRLLRFILEEEVYPHVQLAPGLHYSISRMLHYAILLAGFLLGIALLGFDMTKLTILAGAVGVGLGFGLQNIINNFVSGIILLFERPVKVGDVIQLDSTEGVVTQIGIRASIVRTTNGPEIILPNGKLISDPVTNWTFSRRQRLIIVPLAVVPGVDANRVLEVLKQAAASQASVRREPAPQALLVNFNGGALNFELRVWTDQINDWMQIRSDLAAAINGGLMAQSIAIK